MTADDLRAERDRLAAVVDRVAAIADAPHLATPEALSTALDNIRAAIEGAESHGEV